MMVKEEVPLAFEAGKSRARLLVVDRELDFLRVAQQMGRAQLVDIAVAATAEAALAIAQRRPPDAAVIDAGLGPAEEAFGLAAALRSLPELETLPIAFTSADAHVDIRVAAAHAGGSLYLAKPIEAPAFGAAIQQLISLRRAEQPRVLVLDDDAEFRAALLEMLASEGIAAFELGDGRLLFETLEQVRPELLLLDLEMPGLSGFEVCRMLRMSPRWQQLPVLFVTGRTDLQSRLSAFRVGADDYLAKPVIVEEMLARIRVRLERTRLLRERAERCPLTGALLRRPLLESLSARLSEADRRNQPLSVALLDLDRFKLVNDRFGHLAGDRVLLGFGKLLGARFRASDLRGRWGGEEFLVALPDADEATTRGVLERVLAEFAAMEFEGDAGERFGVSFSGGIACFPRDGNRVEDLIRVADARLYQAKALGRARLVGSGSGS